MMRARQPDRQERIGDSENLDTTGHTIRGVLAGGGRLDKVLAESLEAIPDAPALSRARVQALIADAVVTINGVTATSASAKVAGGDAFAITLPAPTPLAAEAQAIALNIVYEDEHLVVVDKPAGLVVHPAAGNPDGTLVNALLHHCRGQLSGIGGVARPGIVHRIDKDTSGLLVVAKSDAAHEGLSRQFADHSIERAYRAVTNGVPMPTTATLRGVIARSDRDRKKMAIIGDIPADGVALAHRGKTAITHYRVIETLGGGIAALVACRLETGRTHQVRVHMDSIGHALIGDPVYGRLQKSIKPWLQALDFRRQALHAAVLGFIHPVTGRPLRFTSETPADMALLIAAFREP